MPSVARHIWEFIVAIARQWSTIVTGGFIAALILLYEHKTGEPIAGRLFWIAVITSLVVAVFLAWRKERVTVESLTAPRPDFVYEGVGSQITFNVPTDRATTDKPIQVKSRPVSLNRVLQGYTRPLRDKAYDPA